MWKGIKKGQDGNNGVLTEGARWIAALNVS